MIRLIATALLALTARAESLPEILARMDRDAKTFKSMSANVKWVDYTAVIDDSSEQTGEVKLKRGKNGIVCVMAVQHPEPRFLHIDGRKVRRYFPKANTVEVYDVGKYGGSMDQLLLLGFGTSGTELTKEYTIKVLGSEMLGGMPTTRIELTPKSQELQKYVSKFELWIPEGQSNPVQEKALQPSKNYSLIIYSGLTINPQLPDSAFELKLPAGVRTIYPQK